MINEQRAVLVRVTKSPIRRRPKQILSSRCWSRESCQADGLSVLNTSQRPGFVTVICPATKPDAVTNDHGVIHWRWNLSLSAGGTNEVEFVAGDGHMADASKVGADVMRWKREFFGRIRRLQAMLGTALGGRIHAGQSSFLRQPAGAGHGQRRAEAELLHGRPHHVGIGTHTVSGVPAFFHHQRRAGAGDAVLLGRFHASHRLGAA